MKKKKINRNITTNKLKLSKYTPPRHSKNNLLFRERLIEEILFINRFKKLIFIEAHPGQGKSILASQFLSFIKKNYSWFKTDLEDNDEVGFFSSLVQSIYLSLPTFKSITIDEKLKYFAVTTFDIIKVGEIFLKELSEFLKDDFYIVIEDVHLLDEESYTLNLIEKLIETSPKNIHFIITSRTHLFPGLFKNQSSDIIKLDNKVLAFSVDEIKSLFHEIYKHKYSDYNIKLIHTKTEGWTMGLVLARLDVSQIGLDHLKLNSSVDNVDIVSKYFFNKEKFFKYQPAFINQYLIKLSLLREIPLELAVQITGYPKIGIELQTLVNNNYFTYVSSKKKQKTYWFQHLFGNLLQSLSVSMLNSDEIKKLQLNAAQYYLNEQQTEEALYYYFKLKDYKKIEELLTELGLKLIAQNKQMTLLQYLKLVPVKTIESSAVLSMLMGYCLLYRQPDKAIEFLKNSNNIFIQNQNKVFELLSCGYIILYYSFFNVNFVQVDKFSKRSEELLKDVEEVIDDHLKVFIYQQIARSVCLSEGDFKKSNAYIDIALPLAKKNQMWGSLADLYVTRVFNESSKWNWENGKNVFEKAYPLIFDNKVGMISKIALRLVQIDLPTKEGNFDDMRYHIKEIQEHIDDQILEQNILGPVIYKFLTDYEVFNENFSKALKYCKKGIAICEKNESMHIESLFWADHALISIMLSNNTDAVVSINKSLELRESCGGPFFFALFYLTAGATYLLMENFNKAEDYLDKSIIYSKKYNMDMVEAGAFLYKAYICLKKDSNTECIQFLTKALDITDGRLIQFPSYLSTVIKELLTFSVKNNINTGAAKLNAEKKFALTFNKDTPIPILKINLLGSICCEIGDLPSEPIDLSKPQACFLGIVAATSNHKVDKDYAKSILWSDEKYNETSTSNFDVFVYRLKNEFNKIIKPYKISNYLKVEKGYVKFINTIFDSETFLLLADEGDRCFKNQYYMQAEDYYRNALSKWIGSLEESFISIESDRVREYKTHLEKVKSIVSLKWARILVGFQRYEEAVEILENIYIFNQKTDLIITMLYQIFKFTGNKFSAKQLMIKYEKQLEGEGFLPEEIAEIIAEVYCAHEDDLFDSASNINDI